MNTDQIAAEAANKLPIKTVGDLKLSIAIIKSAIEKAKLVGWKEGREHLRESLKHPESRAAHASEHLLDQIEGARNCIRKHFYNQAELILNDVLSQRPTPATASEPWIGGRCAYCYGDEGHHRENCRSPKPDAALSKSGGGEWTDETVKAIFDAFWPGPFFKQVAVAHNAAWRENNEKWRKEVKQFIERQHSLRDYGNDTKRLDLMETQGGQFAKIKGKSWRESADIHAAMRKTGEQAK